MFNCSDFENPISIKRPSFRVGSYKMQRLYPWFISSAVNDSILPNNRLPGIYKYMYITESGNCMVLESGTIKFCSFKESNNRPKQDMHTFTNNVFISNEYLLSRHSLTNQIPLQSVNDIAWDHTAFQKYWMIMSVNFSGGSRNFRTMQERDRIHGVGSSFKCYIAKFWIYRKDVNATTFFINTHPVKLEFTT